MKKRIADEEMSMLKEIAGAFPRHPDQYNLLSEADAEILNFHTKNIDYLVLKIDGLFEELQDKLYEDPFLIGWMGITVTISDLAAAGSKPIGILLALQLPNHLSKNKEWLGQFQNGINAACTKYGVYILGGDTNFGSGFSVTTSGVATVTSGKPMLRKGMSAGELLYSTGKLGIGNAFAYSHYFDSSIKINYKPIARLYESSLIKEFATACIDTSDGLFPALSIFSEVNDIGINLSTPFTDILHPEAMQVCHKAKLSPWILLAGPHGEYELLFTIPKERKPDFEKKCISRNMTMFYLGDINKENNVRFVSDTQSITCEPAQISNLFLEATGDVNLYFKLLMKQQEFWSSHKN